MRMTAVRSIAGMTLEHPEEIYTQASGYVILSTTTAQPTMKTVVEAKRPLAPAPLKSSSTVLLTNESDVRCKKKVQFVSQGVAVQSASVARRNARERNRVKQVNNGFAALRSHIPSSILSTVVSNGGSGRGINKKLSKVETLRLAVQYIRSLQQLLKETEAEGSSHSGDQENSDCENREYMSSPFENQGYSSHTVIMQTSPCSEASSPTPSQSSTYSCNNIYANENYQPQSPEDEELLDAIFSWQHHD